MAIGLLWNQLKKFRFDPDPFPNTASHRLNQQLSQPDVIETSYYKVMADTFIEYGLCWQVGIANREIGRECDEAKFVTDFHLGCSFPLTR
jgi:hypothetical protein